MTDDNLASISGGQVQGIIQENNGIVNQNFITQYAESYSGQAPGAEKLTQGEYRQRTVLLSKVKEYWIEGVLEKSLHTKAMIELGLEKRSDAVDRPFSGFEELPEESRQILPTGTGATEVFNQIGEGRTLLILGEPGAGKTITLLKLAQNLIARAEEDVSLLIPVVFNLSSWGSKQQTIADWLVEELMSLYQVPKEVGKGWVKNQQLLLLLDGLDEVKAKNREACAQAINKFMENNGQTEVVVCSRIAEYESLSTHLRLRGAIFIRSLTPEQINQYLDRADKQLQAVKTLLQEDNLLQELAKSPLTLSIMTLAYRGNKVEELPQTGSVKERRQHLFDSYIKRMFSQEKIGKPREYQSPYQNQQTILWLTWLAQHMTRESKSVFLIEHLQPRWLKTNSQKLLYVLAVPLFIFSVFMILQIFLGLPAMKNYYTELEKSGYFVNTIINPSFLASGMIISYLLYCFVMAWKLIIDKPFFLCRWAKSIANIHFLNNIFFVKYLVPLGDFLKSYYKILLYNYIEPDIEPIESVKWSLSGAVKTLRRNLISLPLIGVIFAVVTIGISTIVVIIVHLNQIAWNVTTFLKDPFSIIVILIASIPILIIISLIFSICFGYYVFIFGGISIVKSVEKTAFPNQGIWKSVKNIFVLIPLGVFLGVTSNIFSIFNFLIPVGIEQKPTLTIPELSFLAYNVLLRVIPLAFLAGGACIKHVVLRIILYCNRYIPWNYASFLNYATDRIFLQKVGGGYIFVHRMLLEHFAHMEFRRD